MRISSRPPTGLIYFGQFLNRGGYSSLSQNFTRALLLNGVPVRIVSYGAFDAAVAQDFGDLVERHRHTDVGENPLVFINDIPDRFMLFEHDGISRMVGSTLFETDRLPAGWADKCNTMDAIVIYSEFNRRTFTAAGVNPDLLLKAPIGVDTDFHRSDNPAISPYDLGPAAGKFVFLYRFGLHYRKGFDLLLEAYLREFNSQDDVALILSCFHVGASGVRRQPGPNGEPFDLHRFFIESIRERSGLPVGADVPLLLARWEWLSEEQKLGMYAACDAYVSTERASGWSLPCMEAMAMGKPAAAIDWGGGSEFMNTETAFLFPISGAMESIDPRIGLTARYYDGHRWPTVTVNDVRGVLRRIYEDAPEREKIATSGAKLVREEFNLHAVGARLADVLELPRTAPDGKSAASITTDYAGIATNSKQPQSFSFDSDRFRLSVRETARPLAAGEEYLPLLRKLVREGALRIGVIGAGEMDPIVCAHPSLAGVEIYIMTGRDGETPPDAVLMGKYRHDEPFQELLRRIPENLPCACFPIAAEVS